MIVRVRVRVRVRIMLRGKILIRVTRWGIRNSQKQDFGSMLRKPFDSDRVSDKFYIVLLKIKTLRESRH